MYLDQEMRNNVQELQIRVINRKRSIFSGNCSRLNGFQRLNPTFHTDRDLVRPTIRDAQTNLSDKLTDRLHQADRRTDYSPDCMDSR